MLGVLELPPETKHFSIGIYLPVSQKQSKIGICFQAVLKISAPSSDEKLALAFSSCFFFGHIVFIFLCRPIPFKIFWCIYTYIYKECLLWMCKMTDRQKVTQKSSDGSHILFDCLQRRDFICQIGHIFSEQMGF